LSSEQIWKIWKKPKLNSEKIWKIQKKIVKRYEKYGRKGFFLSYIMCLILYHFVLCTWCCFTNHFRRL
jgi:hypothetical protein